MNLHGVRVLVVDDRPDSLEVFGEIFDVLGAETRTACSAEAALQELKTFSAHVIVSDLEMPKKDGYRFLRDLRAAGLTVPVIASTGYVTAHHRERAAAAGFAAFLPKPSSVEVISRTVLSVISPEGE